MLWLILRKEIIEIFRDGRFRILATIITALLIVSAWVSYHHQKQLRELHQQAQLVERNVWLSQKSKNPHSAAHFGQYVFKPVFPLSVIDPGADRYVGVMQYLEAHKRNHQQFNTLQDQTELARFADLTPAFVLLFLVPLLLIVLGYNSVTRERENGSMKLLIAQGVSRFILLLTKCLAVVFSIGVFLFPVLMFTGILLSTSPQFYWTAFLCLLVSYLLYYLIIAGITVAISALAKTSGISLLTALFFWIITTILIPRIFSNLANTRAPLLSNEEIVTWANEMLKTRGDNVHDQSGKVYKDLVDSVLKKYKVDSVSQLPVNIAGIRLDFGEQIDTRDFKVIYDSVFRQMDRQQQWLNAGAVFSPFLLTRDISRHIAQTDNENHRHFSDAGEDYRRVLVNRMNRYLAYESGQQEITTRLKAPESVWKSVPEFQYKPLKGKDAFAFAGRSLGLLLAWACIVAVALIIISKQLKL